MDEARALGAASKELREFAKAGLQDGSVRGRLRLLEHAPVLRGLPVVSAAGVNASVQFEYLAQAIIDAISSLDGFGGQDNAYWTPEVSFESRAARRLFGLTEQARHKTWRVRQELAADIFNVSWDHFRKTIQNEIVRAIAERLLSAVPTQADSSANWIALSASSPRAAPTQEVLQESIVQYIHETKPVHAELMELSASTIRPILLALRDVGATIKLLVVNPALVTSPWQQARLKMSLMELLQIDFRGYGGLRVALYATAPSLRGRAIGEVIVLGWYTHRDNQRLEVVDPGAAETWGHDNLVLIGNTHEANGMQMSSWFEREFQRLWAHRGTRIHEDALAILGIAPTLLD